MWKGFFGFLLFMAAFCGIFIGFAMFAGGIGMQREGLPHGNLISVSGGMLSIASLLICRKLLLALYRAFDEDAKVRPQTYYIPGKHRHDPD